MFFQSRRFSINPFGPFVRVLCVRIDPNDIPEATKELFRNKFLEQTLALNQTVTFEYANPATPEELRNLAYQPDVGAVYAQDRPLPTIIIKEQFIPFVFPGPDGLRRVTSIEVKSVPF